MTIRSAAGGPENAIGVIDNILYQRYNLQNPPKDQNAYACSDRGNQRVNFKADNGQGIFAVQGEKILFQGYFVNGAGVDVPFDKLVDPAELDTPEEVTKFLEKHHVSPNPEQPSLEVEGKK